MRHPTPSWVQGFSKPEDQRPNPADQSRGNGAANGAGRSRSSAGVLRRSSASIGGPKSTADTTLRRTTTWDVAAVSAATSGTLAGRKSAGEALAASTRGIAVG
jgi:hypothetical protein